MHKIKHIILLVYYYVQFLFSAQDKYKNKVITGPLFSQTGGVNGHIINLQKNCKTLIFPNEKARKIIAQQPKGLIYFKELYNLNIIYQSKVIHTHGDPWITKKIGSLKGRKFKWVHSYHSIYFKKDWNYNLASWRLEMNKINTTYAQKADVKIAVSKWLKKYLWEHYNIDAIYIPNGVDTDKLDEIKPNRFIEKRHIINFNLFVGDTTSIKGVDLYLKLAQKHPSDTFVLIGKGLTTEWLKEQNYTLNNVKALGPLPHIKTLEAIKDCTRLIITSKSETLPTLLIEALYFEKVTISPNNYGCSEIINNPRIGIQYEPESLQDLSLKYRSSFTNNQLNLSLAKDRVLKEYTWKKIANQLLEIYDY